MTVEKTKNICRKFKLACQTRRFKLKKDSLILNKGKDGFLVRIKKKSKKAYYSLKRRFSKKPISKDEFKILERRISIALSNGMEPPELADFTEFYSETKRSSVQKSSQLWVNDSSILSDMKSRESKNQDFGSYKDDEMFNEYLVGKATGKEQELLGETLLGNLYSMHRLVIKEDFFEENFFEEYLSSCEGMLSTSQKSRNVIAPTLSTVDDSKLIKNVKL